jgi:hypothetical protein
LSGNGAIVARLRRCGFVFIESRKLRAQLANELPQHFDEFAQSWDRLGEDRFMADGGVYRQRRHARFEVSSGRIRPKAHQAHFQDRSYNNLNGGIERWFAPVETAIALGPYLHQLIEFANGIFSPEARGDVYHVEAHQFRIHASAEAPGFPTPEGLHRDGVDWVLVMLVRRRNVAGGVTTIQRADCLSRQSVCLRDPLDTILIDDRRILHEVSPITPADPFKWGYRDVLVLTFSRSKDSRRPSTGVW